MRRVGSALLVLLACAEPRSEPQAQPSAMAAQQIAAPEPAIPPAVLQGDAELHCNISSSANGRQTLHLKGGQGLEFDATVSPIVDGVVEAHGTERGGAYRFTSHLAAAAKGTLSGVGEVTFEALETKVNVAMDRYQQPKGAGTELTFEATDMSARGIYVEFAGRARAANGERYTFRVTLGAPGSGSGGRVQPASDSDQSGMVAKMVTIHAPQTTVVSTVGATTTVQKLP